MKSVRLNTNPSPWGLFQVKTLVFGVFGLLYTILYSIPG